MRPCNRGSTVFSSNVLRRARFRAFVGVAQSVSCSAAFLRTVTREAPQGKKTVFSSVQPQLVVPYWLHDKTFVSTRYRSTLRQNADALCKMAKGAIGLISRNPGEALVTYWSRNLSAGAHVSIESPVFVDSSSDWKSCACELQCNYWGKCAS